MAHYEHYRKIARALDDEGWRIRVMHTAYNNQPFELARKVELECIKDSINLIFSTTGVKPGHWCLDADNLLVTEYDDEEAGCRCTGPMPATVKLPLPLPF